MKAVITITISKDTRTVSVLYPFVDKEEFSKISRSMKRRGFNFNKKEWIKTYTSLDDYKMSFDKDIEVVKILTDNTFSCNVYKLMNRFDSKDIKYVKV